jgi:serine/threonine-protein kinase
MATVHFGRMSSLGGFSRTVAIKRMRRDISMDPEFVAMFLDEARLTSRVEHPNVVATLDVVAEGGEVFLVMEYVRGDSLAHLIRAARQSREAPPLAIAASIICGALTGLHAAHQALGEGGVPLGIIHRDVSPQNILVGEDGITRITDFGIAKAESRLQITRDGMMKGKLCYMAPEQLAGGGRMLDRRVDVFAAGVVAWELLSGNRLFQADHPGETMANVLNAPIPPLLGMREELTPAVDGAIRRALERNPDQRWKTAEEFAAALEDATPIASARVVGGWVSKMAGDLLANRHKYVREIESMGGASGTPISKIQPTPAEPASSANAAAAPAQRPAAAPAAEAKAAAPPRPRAAQQAPAQPEKRQLRQPVVPFSPRSGSSSGSMPRPALSSKPDLEAASAPQAPAPAIVTPKPAPAPAAVAERPAVVAPTTPLHSSDPAARTIRLGMVGLPQPAVAPSQLQQPAPSEQVNPPLHAPAAVHSPAVAAAEPAPAATPPQPAEPLQAAAAPEAAGAFLAAPIPQRGFDSVPQVAEAVAAWAPPAIAPATPRHDSMPQAIAAPEALREPELSTRLFSSPRRTAAVYLAAVALLALSIALFMAAGGASSETPAPSAPTPPASSAPAVPVAPPVPEPTAAEAPVTTSSAAPSSSKPAGKKPLAGPMPGVPVPRTPGKGTPTYLPDRP